MVRSASFVVVMTLALASQASAAAINISSLRSIDGSYCVISSCTETFSSSTDASGSVSMFDFDIILTPSTMHEFSASQATNLDAFGVSGEMSATASTQTDPDQAPTARSIGDSFLSFGFEVPTPHTFSFAATLLGTSSTGAFSTIARSDLIYCDPATSICDVVFGFHDSGDDTTPSLVSSTGLLLPGLSYQFFSRATATADAGPGFPFDNIEFAEANADFTFTLTETATAVPEPSTLLLLGFGVVAATRRRWRR